MAITDPRDIPGLVVWYSAEAETGYTDGQSMTGWTDLSGNGNHATGVAPAGSVNPKWKATLGPGGGPVVHLDGGYFSLPANVIGAAGTAGTVAANLKPTLNNAGIWKLSGSTALAHFPYGLKVYDTFGSTVQKATNASVALNTWYRYRVSAKAGGWQAWLNGTSVYSTATNTVSWAAAPELGRSGANDGWRYPGLMSTFVLYNRELTSTEGADLDAWMAAHPSGGTAAPTVVSGTLNLTAPAAVVDLSERVLGAVALTAPAADMSIIGDVATSGTLALTAPAASVAFTGTVASVAAGPLSMRAPAARVALAGTATAVIGTDTSDDGDGIVLDGYALVESETAVTPMPAGRSRGVRVSKAFALPPPDIDNGRPT